MSTSEPAAPKTDIEIAHSVEMRPIREIAAGLGIEEKWLHPYGHHIAKLSLELVSELRQRPRGKLILMAGITPTHAGEGKSTTTIGLADALRRRDKRSMICLREPSLGPCFGLKGGATGGGYSQVVPMEKINLHFTGDIHAVGAAHNLLAAMIDNHIYWEDALQIDQRRISWRRVVDMNDRALRNITNGLGGVTNGFPRSDGFDITVASEVMAVLCLATDLHDLQQRLGDIIVAHTRDLRPIHASDLEAQGAMTALLKEALQPNLVQTLEHTPALIHGGPFANIAHGCSSVLATTSALGLADYVVTEAGFGADLGAEKFFNIKCRKAGLVPDCAVIVCTVRALKLHGGAKPDRLTQVNPVALAKGTDNLARHVENTRGFGVPVIVAINRFTSDTDAEIDLVQQACAALEVETVVCDHWARGGEGALDLADSVVRTIDSQPGEFRLLYEDSLPLWQKIRRIATRIYRARDIIADQKVRDQIAHYQAEGYGHFPICIAKTPHSFTTDPNAKGIPSKHVVPIREVRLANGAGFLVVICGDVMTMPGLPRVPRAANVQVTESGEIVGLH